MHLFWFFFLMCLAGVAFTWLEPILVLPAIGVSALAQKLGNRVFYPVAAIGLLWQVYVVLAWSLFALLLTKAFMGQHRWIYYLVGFAECLAPLGYMAAHSYMHGPPSDAFEDFKTMGIIALAAVAFILFGIVPVLTTPWLWWFRLF
jgi:hypothetical protein